MLRNLLSVAILLILALVAGLVVILLLSSGSPPPPGTPPVPAPRAPVPAPAPPSPDSESDPVPIEVPAPVSAPATKVPAKAPLRVLTNVPGAEVGVWFRIRGDGEGPPAVEAVTDENGEAAIPLPVRREDLETALVTVAARGWSTVRAESKGEDVPLDAEGQAVIREVPPGVWTVEVATSRGMVPDDFGIPVERAVKVEGEAESRLDFLIRSGGRLIVTVRDGAGKIVPAGRVRLLDEGGERILMRFWRRKGEGWTTLLDGPAPAHSGRAVPQGRYTVEVLGADGRVRASKEVVVSYRQTVEVEIRLPE